MEERHAFPRATCGMVWRRPLSSCGRHSLPGIVSERCHKDVRWMADGSCARDSSRYQRRADIDCRAAGHRTVDSRIHHRLGKIVVLPSPPGELEWERMANGTAAARD